MRLWVSEIGEPLPQELDMRPHRYGLFSAYLADKGHDVVWWTSTFSHAPKRHVVEVDTELRDHAAHRVVRLIKGPGYHRNVSLARVLHNRHYAREFLRRAVCAEQPDIVLAPVPTIASASAAVQYAQARKVPVLVDIRDQWPDELVDVAPGPLRWLARALLAPSFRRMRWLCRQADGIMGVSRSYIEYGLSFAARTTDPNDLFFPLGYSTQVPAPDAMRDALRWCRDVGIGGDKFVVCFFGTVGRYFALAPVIEAVIALSQEFGIQLVIGGDGSHLGHYRALARGHPSIVFPGWLGLAQIHAVMALSSVGIAPYKDGARMSLPNKPFEYMAGRLPVLASLRGELGELLVRYRCGLIYRAESVEELMAAMRHLHRAPDQRLTMGRNGRLLLEGQFMCEAIFARVEAELVRISEQTRR